MVELIVFTSDICWESKLGGAESLLYQKDPLLIAIAIVIVIVTVDDSIPGTNRSKYGVQIKYRTGNFLVSIVPPERSYW